MVNQCFNSFIINFRDEIDLESYNEKKKLDMILVDHNVLPINDKKLESSIKYILDHHKNERLTEPGLYLFKWLYTLNQIN